MDERTQLATEILQKLGEAGTGYVVLRNADELFDTLGHDIDLGIAQRDLFEANLYSIGQFLKVDVMRTQLSGPHSCYLIFSRNKYFKIKIDAWEGIDYRNIILISPTHLIKNSTEKQRIKIASIPLQIVGILLKETLYNKQLEQKHIARIAELYKKISKEHFVKECSEYLSIQCIELFLEILENLKFNSRQIKDLFLERRKILNDFFWKNPIASVLSYMGWIKDQVRAFAKPPGLLITLVGPDGSGKSTLCNDIEAKLKWQLFNRVRYYHGHPEILPRLGVIKAKLLREPLPVSSASPFLRLPEKGNPHHPIKGCLYVLYYTLDYFLARLPFRFHKARNDLILFDRYFYDYTMQPLWERTPRCFLKLASLFIPKPDLFVFLMADPRVIHARKPELTPEEIAGQQSQMQKLMINLKPSIVIDTTENVEGAVASLTNALVEKYIEHGFSL